MTSNTKVIAARYTPRREAVRVHNRTKRFGLVVCHRRWGKTVMSIHELKLRALMKNLKADNARNAAKAKAAGKLFTPRPDAATPRYAYVAPFRTQAKDNAWDYLKESVADIPGMRISESELSVTFPHNGARIKIYGADDPDSLRGGYFDGIVLDEYGDMKGEVWTAVVRPMLSDYEGWVLFIGTPKGHNAFYEQREKARLNVKGNWFYLEVKASESGVLSQEELADARLEMDDDEYAAEYECSFDAAIKGSYYGKYISDLYETHVVPVPHYQGARTYAFFDFGRGDATACGIVQVIRGNIHFVDFMQVSNQWVGEIADALLEMRDANGDRYEIETLYVPWDARSEFAVAELPLLEQLQDMTGIDVEPVQRHFVKDGIHAVRKMLPQMYFDDDRCYALVEHLKAYSRKYNRDKQVFAEDALHDIHSHAADMVRYCAWQLTPELLRKSSQRTPKPLSSKKGKELYDAKIRINTLKPLGVTLDQLYASQRRGPSRPTRI